MRLAGLLLALLGFVSAEDRCTTIAVGKHASAEGGTIVTHSDDCLDCDGRVAIVPPRDWPDGSLRPVFEASFTYPRFVSEDSAEEYKLKYVDRTIFPWNDTKPIGYIPQVKHTYGYIDGDYPLMNEHQLAIGESTCGARLKTAPASAGGVALFDITALSRVALERCKTARHAIQLMGQLAEEYGFYSSPWDGPAGYTDAGEALTVSDGEEVWVFHILPDDTGTSAVWAAQRVPHDHVAVVANQFIIMEVDRKDKDNFMASDNLEAVAERAGLYNPKKDGPFHFTNAYAMPRTMYPYATRRQWRVYHMVDADSTVPSDTTPLADDYPFSVPVSQPLAVQDIINIQRDHYEGTKFDLTKGIAGGPYGDPSRFDLAATPDGDVTVAEAMTGEFERAISLFRCSYSIIAVSRPHLPREIGALVWFGRYEPRFTMYTPLYAAAMVASRTRAPSPFTTGSLYGVDRGSAFWGHVATGNWVDRFYIYAIGDVAKAQERVEGKFLDDQADVESHAASLLESDGEEAACEYLADYSDTAARTVLDAAWDLFEWVVARYHDGMRVDDFHAETINPTKFFYPKWWLQVSGYFEMDPRDIDPAQREDVMMEDDTAPDVLTPAELGQFVAIAMVCGLAAGVAGGRAFYKKHENYERIA